MGLISRWFRSLENPALSLRDPDAWSDAGLSEVSLSGVKVTPRKALGHPPLWRGVNLLSNGVKKLRPYVYANKEDGSERDKTHPAYRMLRWQSNPWITAGQMRRTQTFHKILYGNSYTLIVRDRRGNPLELVLLDPSLTLPIQRDGAVWYGTSIRGERRWLPAQDVLHLKGLSTDGLIGLSLIEILADAIGLGISAREFAARWFSQGMNASGILMIPGHLQPDAIKNAIADFEKIATGVTKQHRIALLQDGVKWQPTTVNAKDSQLLEARQFDVRDIANILGVPPHKLGDSSRTSYNSLEIENQSWLDDSLDPHLGDFEEEFEAKLLTEEQRRNDTHKIEFLRAAILQTDLQTRAQVYASGRQWGWLSVNDIRRKENDPTIGPAGDIYLQPGNMAPAGAPPAKTPAAKQADPPPPPADEEDQPAAPAATEEDDDRSERLVSAVNAAIQDRVRRLDEIERKQSNAAGFWFAHQTRVREALAPLFAILAEASGRAPEPDALAARYVTIRQADTPGVDLWTLIQSWSDHGS